MSRGSGGEHNKASRPPVFSLQWTPTPTHPYPGTQDLQGVKPRLQETEGIKWARAAHELGLEQLPHFLRGRALFHSLKVFGMRGAVGRKTRVLNNEIPNRKGSLPLAARGLESYK